MTDKLLTESIRDIAETVGVEIAAALVEHFGGTRLYIPAKPKPHQAIVQKLEAEHLETLVSAYSGQEIDVPMHLFNEALARRRLVKSLRKKNRSINAIALEARCTERQVYAILAEGDDKQKQLL